MKGAKPLLIGTVAGSVVIFAAGIATFLLPPLADFYAEALTAGTATGVSRPAPLFWAALLGAMPYGALVTLAVLSHPGRLTVMAGAKAGAIVGFLLWLTADMMLYAVTNVGNLRTMLLGPVVELVPGAFAGGVIALLLARLEIATTAPRRRAAA